MTCLNFRELWCRHTVWNSLHLRSCSAPQGCENIAVTIGAAQQRSPHSSGHRTAAVTAQQRSPHSSGHRTAAITAQQRSPHSSGHRTAAVTAQQRSRHSSGHRTAAVTAQRPGAHVNVRVGVRKGHAQPHHKPRA
ncbi:unnamed protein product [Closterium sp. NIES-54]